MVYWFEITFILQLIIKYSVWDKLKALNEHSGSQISNLAKMLIHLFIEKGLPISTLKVSSQRTIEILTFVFRCCFNFTQKNFGYDWGGHHSLIWKLCLILFHPYLCSGNDSSNGRVNKGAMISGCLREIVSNNKDMRKANHNMARNSRSHKTCCEPQKWLLTAITSRTLREHERNANIRDKCDVYDVRQRRKLVERGWSRIML